MFNTVEEAISWVTHRKGNNLGFEHFKNYIKQENNYVNQLKYIHVAGTNGKGSTCNYLCDCLMEAGYKVGTFTSPHLVCHQDRICINHEWIDDFSFLAICNERKTLWEKYNLNMFEIDFEIMSIYFVQNQVDIVVLEVGIGGRLDCTNVIEHSLASIIVSIDMDHMDKLGYELSAIAYEKAGIIKDQGLVICGESKEECVSVIKKIAEDNEAAVNMLKPITSINENHFSYRDITFEHKQQALYQMHNACCAIETLYQCSKHGLITINIQQIKCGIQKSTWAGRYEELAQNPKIIIDGAHNIHGVKALIESLKKEALPLYVVFAVLKDKDTQEMIELLYDNCTRMIVTEFDFYRAAKASALKTKANIQVIEDWKEAIAYAKTQNKQGTIIVCGSLYFISEVRTYLIAQQKI